MDDYESRCYLSAIEAAKYLGVTVRELHDLTKRGAISADIAASGQKRYQLPELKLYIGDHSDTLQRLAAGQREDPEPGTVRANIYTFTPNGTVQQLYVASSTRMAALEDESIHLMITSPPYYNAKMYGREPLEDDLGNIHDLDEWFERITEVWSEVYRVLQPGRKAFINIMNLPVRIGKTFRTLNLVGRTVDVCERIGFIFKRDIIWHKTNGVRAHFGTYPYPGGILINHMHEFILELEKPAAKGSKSRKYAHVTTEQRERSKLDKEFWLSLKNSDVWLMNPEKSGDHRSHVAPFPLELPQRLIRAFSYIGETVLDPFAGSCTVLKAALALERNGIGYELNPEIAAEAVEELEGMRE